MTARPKLRASAAQQMARPDPGSGLSLLAIKLYATQKSALYNFFAVSLKRVAVVQDFLVRSGISQQASHRQQSCCAARQLPALAASTANELVRLKAMLPAAAPFLVMVVPTRFEIRDGTLLYRDLRREVMKELALRGISRGRSAAGIRRCWLRSDAFQTRRALVGARPPYRRRRRRRRFETYPSSDADLPNR